MADDEEEEPLPCTWRKQRPKKIPGDEEEEEDEDEELPQGDRDENGVPIGDGEMTYPDGAKFVGTLISGGLREGECVHVCLFCSAQRWFSVAVSELEDQVACSRPPLHLFMHSA